jgi:hypothetical protein
MNEEHFEFEPCSFCHETHKRELMNITSIGLVCTACFNYIVDEEVNNESI